MLTSVALIMLVIGAFGVTVADELSPSGFQDPGAESSRAAKQLTEKFGQATYRWRWSSPRPTASTVRGPRRWHKTSSAS